MQKAIKAIKVDLKNVASIRSALLEADGKGKERTLANALTWDAGRGEVWISALSRNIDAIETHLETIGIPKKYRVGAIAAINGTEGKMPNAYKYRYSYTSATFERRATGWFFVGAERKEAWPSERIEGRTVAMTAKQKGLVAKAAIAAARLW